MDQRDAKLFVCPILLKLEAEIALIYAYLMSKVNIQREAQGMRNNVSMRAMLAGKV